MAVSQCRIENYSEGGLFLQMDAAALGKLKIISTLLEEQVVHGLVRLVHQETGAELPFEIPVQIVFAGNQGYGVAFMNPAKEVLSYFEMQHKRLTSTKVTPVSTPTPLPEKTRLLLSEIERSLVQHVSERFPDFVSKVIEELLLRSEQVSLQEKPNYIYACAAIERSKASLQKSLLEHLSVNLDQPLRAGREADSTEERLELVDQDEFDEWAAITSIARYLEGDFSSILHTLSQCFAYVLKVPVNSDSNPLSPYSLLWAFKKSTDPLNLHHEVHDIVFKVFGERVLSDMQELYSQAYDGFDKSGVIAKVGEMLKKLASRQASSKSDSAEEKGSNGRRRPTTLINKLSSLFGRGADAKTKTTGESLPTPSNQAIAQALDNLPSGDNRKLLERIERSLGQQAGGRGPLALSSEDREIVSATEQLIGAAQQDPRHGEVMQSLLNQIQVPLTKQALDNPASLNDAEGVPRQLLENIDQLALLTPATGGSTQIQRANAELNTILASLESAGGNADLGQVSEQISELLEKRKGDFSANIQQVQEGCLSEARSKEHLAKVRGFLSETLGDSVSGLVDELLRMGWAGLLAETTAQGDAATKALKAYQNIVTVLHKAYQPTNRSVTLEETKRDRLNRILQRGFEAYPVHLHESYSLIDKIGKSLGGDEDLFVQCNKPRIEVTETYLDDLLPGSTVKQLPPEKAEGSSEWLAQVAKLQQGDWITNQLKQGQVRLLNLVWIAPDHGRFVFVDGSGMKVLDCGEVELAEELRSGQCSVIEDGGLPMVERAVDCVLRQTFERLRDDSDVDAVTGLQNRRAYDRALARLLNQSKRESSEHVLICIDVDNFSLVNDLLGYEGADGLLGSVANVCKSFIPKAGLLFRTGDSEFRVLIGNSRTDEGFRVAESVRKSVEHLRFEWVGKVASVTVSVGLTEITAASGAQDSITQAAGLACQQAKQEGRNCSRRYQSDGEIFAHRKRMAQTVPMIESALENNRLELHAQLISPIFFGEGHEEHHEILLRRLDDDGAPCSPFEIIEAAERYDRMRAVDRWVVQRFFKWADSAAQKHDLSTLGGFSINLSGQSMTDDSFHEFILRQVKSSVIPLEHISFEITETAMVKQVDQAKKLILQLKELGCTFFLDDFGSGYANYSYLKDFPIDVVKVDGIFVKNIHEDDTSYAMVKSITEVAHHLGKLVVAEFVENELILSALRRLEVDFAQGYCLGRPAPLDDLIQQPSF